MVKSTKPPLSNEQIAVRVSLLTIVINILLVIIKLFAGIVAHSSAMLSDAIHSLSDVVSTVVVIFGVKIANKKADPSHPYGHEKMECLAAILLAVLLGGTGIKIGYDALHLIFASTGGQVLQVPTALALLTALVSIAVKEWMYWYTLAAAKKINSGAMHADAWHHRSDALSSVGSFLGIGGSMLGFPICDPLASMIICFLIVKVSYDILNDAINKLVDSACSDELTNEFRQLVLSVEGVISVDMLKTRMFGSKYYIDVDISVCKDLTLESAHAISEQAHDAIENHYPNVKHCMIHVNPGLCSAEDLASLNAKS